MPLLRVALESGRPGDYPEKCILCGTDASAQVERTFTYFSFLRGYRRRTTQVPVCPKCAQAISQESRFQWLTILVCLMLFALSCYLLGLRMLWPGLACLAGIPMVIGVRRRFSSRYSVPCVELTERHALLDVRTAAFAEAYRAHQQLGGESEAPLDMFERMAAEGFKLSEIFAALQSRGLSILDAAQTQADYAAGRDRARRALGFQLLGLGVQLGAAGALLGVFRAHDKFFVVFLVMGFAYFVTGVVRLLTDKFDRFP